MAQIGFAVIRRAPFHIGPTRTARIVLLFIVLIAVVYHRHEKR
jgi:hypothetical protein